MEVFVEVLWKEGSPMSEKKTQLNRGKSSRTIFLTMALTGLRPGEVVHLLVPNDVDWEHGLIRVRNKPDLGWRTKTRNERDIPIIRERGGRTCF